MSMIQIANLKKYYGKNRGVEDISLNVNAGEIVGFVGPNGAGKSTTIKVLFNFIYPDGGTASICGMDIAAKSKEIKAFTGYVPSDVRLYPDFKISELFLANRRFYGQDQSAEIERLCNLFEVDRSKRFSELSTGNKKKIAIICALASRPKVLVLDEPTSGLDPMMQKVLFTELKRQTENGVGILLSSHNLSEVQEYCSRVAFIKKGRIITVSDLKETTPQKIVTVKGCKSPIPDSMELLEQKDGEAVFRFGQDAPALLRLLTALQPADFTIEDEGIESRFMNLYQEGETQ